MGKIQKHLKISQVRSPLRYPGGKQKAIALLSPYLPASFREYREPFVGGGSMYFHVRQKYPEANCWINDLNDELFHFWLSCRDYQSYLRANIWRLKHKFVEGKALYQYLVRSDVSGLWSATRGGRFFILNRITFSGTVESGGYSESAFKERFTDSSIQRLYDLDHILKDTLITNEDYSEVLTKPGHNAFIYCDPPYLSAKKSKLYGKNGNLHTNFNHEKFAQDMRSCQHKWMITYDDCEEVRSLFSWEGVNIYETRLQYGMSKVKSGEELVITNYEIIL